MITEISLNYFVSDIFIYCSFLFSLSCSRFPTIQRLDPLGNYFIVFSISFFSLSTSLEVKRNSFIEVFISALMFLISKGSFMVSECFCFCFVDTISFRFMKMLMVESRCFSPCQEYSNLVFLCLYLPH